MRYFATIAWLSSSISPIANSAPALMVPSSPVCSRLSFICFAMRRLGRYVGKHHVPLVAEEEIVNEVLVSYSPRYVKFHALGSCPVSDLSRISPPGPSRPEGVELTSAASSTRDVTAKSSNRSHPGSPRRSAFPAGHHTRPILKAQTSSSAAASKSPPSSGYWMGPSHT